MGGGGGGGVQGRVRGGPDRGKVRCYAGKSRAVIGDGGGGGGGVTEEGGTTG